MSKPNTFLTKMEAAYQRKLNRDRELTVQQCQDLTMIALNRAFGFGPERLHQFAAAYGQVWEDYAELTVTDSEDDKSIVYTKAKVDEVLKRICGPYFIPFDERYR